ncbi:MAG: 16S rRNA (guanine(527)-N(7))-methyltransferase RsmG, partial [Anaerolineales bacterium]
MEKLARDARALFNVHITGRQVMALITYEKELIEWNQKFNLTAIRDTESIRTKHFLDSFSCILAWRAAPPNHLIDIGTGAGFPGLPLKILYPNLKLTLVESVGKKAMFCQHIVRVLGLEHVNVIQARAEDLGQNAEHREKYDWAVARAVANLNVLSEYLLPLV